MPNRGRDPLAVPDEFWHRDEVMSALGRRDIGAFFRLLRRHMGASQTQIGIATGLEQGYVSRIMAGRKVIAIDVLERIADGCGMSDDSRALLGLAGRDRVRASGSVSGAPLDGGSWQGSTTDAVEFW